MNCAHIAFDNAGVKVGRLYSYEIDKYANAVSKHNFPNDIYLGNVFEADFTQYEGIDYLVGGSPCTYWSIAKKNGRETEASGIGWELFQQFVRALNEAKPKYFIYENNKSMSKQIRASIDEAFGFEAVLINSALVSAQNRQRLYWVGKCMPDGTYRKVNVEQPQDRGILLRDILESGVVAKEKSYCLKHQAGNIRDHFKKHHTDIAYEPVSISEPVRIGTIESDLKNKKHDSKQYRVYSPDGKATTLCGQGGGVGAKTGLYAVPVTIEWLDGKQHTVYEVRNGYITIKDKQYPIKLADGFYIIRKLTVRECMRLQTVPEWYDFSVISNSRAYRCLGNAWTCDVITHLIRATMEVKV